MELGHHPSTPAQPPATPLRRVSHNQQSSGSPPRRGAVKIQNMLTSTEGSPTRGGGTLQQTPARGSGSGIGSKVLTAVEESPVFSDDELDPPHGREAGHVSDDSLGASENSSARGGGIVRDLFAAGSPSRTNGGAEGGTCNEPMNARVPALDSDSENDADDDSDGYSSTYSVSGSDGVLQNSQHRSFGGRQILTDEDDYVWEWQGSLAGSLESVRADPLELNAVSNSNIYFLSRLLCS